VREPEVPRLLKTCPDTKVIGVVAPQQTAGISQAPTNAAKNSRLMLSADTLCAREGVPCRNLSIANPHINVKTENRQVNGCLVFDSPPREMQPAGRDLRIKKRLGNQGVGMEVGTISTFAGWPWPEFNQSAKESH